jgi:tetratricopeptide (TPR) repeat protein/S1-C subfamily serine protease
MILGGKRLVCWVPAVLVVAVGVSALRAAVSAPAAAPPRASPPETAKALEPADILARARSAVVVVLAQDAKGEKISQGSGFIASAEGLVVTNWHVVGGASTAVVKQENGAFCPVEGVVAWDAKRDFAILKIAGKGVATIAMGDSDKVRQGDRVLVLGSPQGLENTASEGIVSAVRELPGGQKLLQMTAAISQGSSGGPVLNAEGRVVGIASFMVRQGQSLNFAVPINEIKPDIKAGRATPLAEAGLPSATGTAEALVLQGLRALPEDESAPGARAKFEAALALFREALAKRPDYADAHFGVGCCMAKLGRSEEAAEAFKQVIRIKPDYAEAHLVLGSIYGKLGRWQEAADAFKQAIRVKPECADAHLGVGICTATLGRWQEAAEALKQVIRIRPEDAEAQLLLGAAYGSLGRWEEAADAYKQAIQIKPDYAEAHYLLGVAYLWELGRWQEAAEAFKQAIRIKPDYAEAHYHLGVAYAKLGRYQDEIEEHKQAIRIKPDYAEAHSKLGAGYLVLHRYQDGIEEFRQAIRIKPDYAEAHLGLGVAHLALGDPGAALDEYKILKDLDPNLAAELFKLLYP